MIASTAELTPAEAMILLEPRQTKSTATLKITLMALLVQRVLVIEEEVKRNLFGREKQVAHVKVAERPSAMPQSPHAVSVVDLVRSAGSGTMSEIVASARKVYGAGFFKFNETLLKPELVRRGLLAAVTVRHLLFIKTTRHTLTPAGEVEQGRLRGLMDRAREIPTELDRDPAQAAAMAAALGGLILLVPELKPHFRALSDAMRRQSDLDLTDFDVDFDSFDLGSFDGTAFDSLDASMSAMDSGFDSASSDGGGDSGGDSGGSDSGGGGE